MTPPVVLLLCYDFQALLTFKFFKMKKNEFTVNSRLMEKSISGSVYNLFELDNDTLEDISKNMTACNFQLCHGNLLLVDDSEITWSPLLEMEEPEYNCKDGVHSYPLSFTQGNYILPRTISGINAELSKTDGTLHVQYGVLGTVVYLYQLGLGLIVSNENLGCTEILDSIICNYEANGTNVEFTFCDDEEDELWD